jgi:gamma-glutamyltranspeptidase / glutathione hydrolase
MAALPWAVMGSPRPRRGAVAAGDHRTVDAGLHALREGGNAVDAAVAALLCATVVEPLLTSLGGGGVALVRDGRDGEVRAHDFFGVYPGRDRPAAPIPSMKPVLVDYGVEQQIFHIGSGAVAVPGLPAGIEHLHRHYGTLPLTVLAEPAVHHARAGIEVGANLQVALMVIQNLLRDDPEVARRYLPGGAILAVGATLRQPDLGDTVERFAREGAALFYRGDLARALLDFAGGDAGQLTPEDLAAYRCRERAPVRGIFRDARFATVPPPAAGGALLAYALGVLHHIGPLGTRVDGPTLLQLARVMSAADAVRDETFHRELDTPSYLAELLGEDSLARGAAAAVGEATDRAPADNPVGSTTHLNTVDRDGWMVSITSSNGETCGHLLPGAGVLLNNFLGEEDLQGPADVTPAPGSRIRTMMTPTLVRLADGSRVALGSGGANRIRSALLQGIVHLVDRGAPLAEAVTHSRIHHEAGVCRVEEPGIDPDALVHLQRHLGELTRYEEPHMYFGGLHAVALRPDGSFDGAGDPRRGGCCGEV